LTLSETKTTQETKLAEPYGDVLATEPNVGCRFGKWLILARAPSLRRLKRWLCLCDCGTKRAVLGTNLRRGRSAGCEMCGPLRSGIAALRHGASNTAEYNVWKSMLRRCRSPKTVEYARYGGRGISVCERWSMFENFIADMGLRPQSTSRYTIERRDNDLGYSPDNCYWATYKEQANNTSRNRRLTFQGETHTVTEWAHFRGLPFGCLHARLRSGWSIERALTTPLLSSRTERREATVLTMQRKFNELIGSQEEGTLQ